VVNGVEEAAEWTAVRMTKNYQGNQGVTDVNSPDMRCFQMRPGTTTATIAAGEKLGFVANAEVTHFGPVQFYMAKVPDTADINTWEAAGNVWFKAGSISAVKSGAGWDWPAYSMVHRLRLTSSCCFVRIIDEVYRSTSCRLHHPN